MAEHLSGQEANQTEALERSSVPTLLTRGAHHQIFYVNAAAERLLGTARSELISKPAARMFKGPQTQERLDQILGSGEANCLHGSGLTRGDGHALEASVVAAPTDLPAGSRQGLTLQLIVPPARGEGDGALLREFNERLIVSALREQAAAEEADRRTRQLETLLENMGEGVTVFDTRKKVALVNAACRQLFGFEESPGSVEDYQRVDLHRQDGSAVDFDRELTAPLLQGERYGDQEVLVTRRDAQRRHLLLSGSPVRDGRGEVRLAVQICRDITPMRELEQMRSQYLSLISHDLRGPISSAKLAVQMLARAGEDPERRGALTARIDTNLDRMEQMVADLLDAQRIRAGEKLNLLFHECDLAEISRGVAEELAPLHGDRVVVAGEARVTGIWNAAQLRRAIWNLACNALKYGAQEAKVLITVERRQASAAVLIHNEGDPIPPGELAALFAPFSRTAPAARSGTRGWGLGLTLVRGCAEAHGGQVRVQSEPGAGTTFELELPLDSRTGRLPA